MVTAYPPFSTQQFTKLFAPTYLNPVNSHEITMFHWSNIYLEAPSIIQGTYPFVRGPAQKLLLEDLPWRGPGP
jgi:hypothetical protein